MPCHDVGHAMSMSSHVVWSRVHESTRLKREPAISPEYFTKIKVWKDQPTFVVQPNAPAVVRLHLCRGLLTSEFYTFVWQFGVWPFFYFQSGVWSANSGQSQLCRWSKIWLTTLHLPPGAGIFTLTRMMTIIYRSFSPKDWPLPLMSPRVSTLWLARQLPCFAQQLSCSIQSFFIIFYEKINQWWTKWQLWSCATFWKGKMAR